MGKTITELRDEKNGLRTASQEIIDKAKAESRALTSEETQTLDANKVRMHQTFLHTQGKFPNSHGGANF